MDPTSDHPPRPVISLDAGGRLLSANPAAAALLGDDLAGTSLADHLLDPDDAAELIRSFRRSTGPVPGSVALVADGGQGRPVFGRRDTGSDGVVIEFRDLADNRFAELTATLQRLHVEIRRRKRAEAELHEVLASTVSDLSHANQRLAEFSRAAAHDLRTPLTVMSGFAELLLSQHELPEKARGMVERILRASSTCSDMVEHMLVTARGDLVVQTEIDFVAEIERLRVLLGVTELRLTHGRLEPIRVPATPFRQVLLNLVTNAVKHRGSLPSVTVHITVHPVPGGWEVVVADDGPGVPEEDRERVFEEGERLHEETPGNGLGLSQCRRLAAAWGGSLALGRSVLGGLAASIFVPHDEADVLENGTEVMQASPS